MLWIIKKLNLKLKLEKGKKNVFVRSLTIFSTFGTVWKGTWRMSPVAGTF